MSGVDLTSHLYIPVDTGRKYERTLDIQKTSRTSSERLMYVQFTSYVYEDKGLLLTFLNEKYDFLNMRLLFTVKNCLFIFT